MAKKLSSSTTLFLLLFSLLLSTTQAQPLTPQQQQQNQQRTAPRPGQPTDDNPLTPSPAQLKHPLTGSGSTSNTNSLPQPKPMRAGDGGATRGVTDGEPGSNVEAHCCGMKGLGGAKVEVLCHPDTVAMGQTFNVNVKYVSDVKRPVDLHVDVLNAQSKTYYAGKWEEFETQAGETTLTIKMPDYNVQEPFLWKVFLTPRGEPFPNMLAETGFVAHLAGNVQNDCTPIQTKAFDPPELANNDQTVDYVLLTAVPKELIPNTRATVEATYNLVSTQDATISAALMRKGPNTIISSFADVAKPGQNTVKLTLPVPADAPREAVYIVVTLTPEGAAWEDRLAEDRTYRTKMAGTRLLRVVNEEEGKVAGEGYEEVVVEVGGN